MHRNVEVLIGRLATDPTLQRRFAQQPLEALLEQHLELTEVELAALAATDPDAVRAFTASLDRRLRLATPHADTRPGSDPTRQESTNDSTKETQR